MWLAGQYPQAGIQPAALPECWLYRRSRERSQKMPGSSVYPLWLKTPPRTSGRVEAGSLAYRRGGASKRRDGHPPAPGRSRKALDPSAVSRKGRQIRLLEKLALPTAGTRSSSERVETGRCRPPGSRRSALCPPDAAAPRGPGRARPIQVSGRRARPCRSASAPAGPLVSGSAWVAHPPPRGLPETLTTPRRIPSGAWVLRVRRRRRRRTGRRACARSPG